jgi:2'-hydroxyisoflavone reductase
MRLLVIGGTMFLGRALVEAALALGHEVTLFHRGRHGAELFPQVERVLGDRLRDLGRLAAGHWDLAIDTCAYRPSEVEIAADALLERVGRYQFVGSISAYADPSRPGLSEDAPLAAWSPEDGEELSGESYGPLKAACEAVVRRRWGARALLVRPGLIVGPWDPSDRFTWWAMRSAAGGRMPVPADLAQLVQWIDVRDLAEWQLHAGSEGLTGPYNLAGPLEPATLGDLLAGCLADAADPATPVPMPAEFLLGQGVAPWTEIPLWLPGEEARGLEQVDIRRAAAAGLRTRPLLETLRDLRAWLPRRDWSPPRAGLPPAKETALLAAWDG